jgi:hypothetical protein
MAQRRWKAERDPLYRGDVEGGVSLPSPSGDSSIVRHLLYLGGSARETPYLSTTEEREIAEQFAGAKGQVYRTEVPAWHDHGVRHISRVELLDVLKGSGKGKASWHSAYEVMRARQYVEETAEHLADFSATGALSAHRLRQTVDTLFVRA